MDQHLDEASYMKLIMSVCWWIWSESALVSTRWESNLGHCSEGSACTTCDYISKAQVKSNWTYKLHI